MDEVFTWLEQRFGPEVRTWIAGLPALAAQAADRWGLRLGEMFAGGAASVVYRCEWTDGSPAVLKLSPGKALLAEQADMLRLFAGSGRVPAVLAAAPDLGAAAVEEIVPGTPADDLPLDTLPRPWAALMNALHDTAAPEQARVLRGRCDEFFARIGQRLTLPEVAAHVDPTLWRRTIERCRRLLDTQTRTVLLHGDLHLGNVLDGGAGRGLVAIDPKACVGDPCFDAMDLVVAGNGVVARCEQVARACGLDGDRLFEWSRVDALLVAIGRLCDGEAGPFVDELLAVARGREVDA